MRTHRALTMPSAALLERYDVAGPRYTSYPTVPEWSAKFTAEDHARALERCGQQATAPLSLYVHIPFCNELCTYCGCNVIVSHDPGKGDRYVEALVAELAQYGERLGERRQLARVHLGGGTPTWLNEAQLTKLWRGITDTFHLGAKAEVAIEVDPVVTSIDQLRILAGLGFNRISMGVQDFDAEVQRAVHRVQSYDETRAVIEATRTLGFTSRNVDLIYGLPHQTHASWARTLDLIVALAPERIAAFSFAYVPSARANQRKIDAGTLPTPTDKLGLFALTHERLATAGYGAIGMDHFALPGDELYEASLTGQLWRDFQGYTTRRADETLGVGVSSIGFQGSAYAQNVKLLSEYHAAIAAGRPATAAGMWLSDDDLRRRDIIISLMCNLEVDLGATGAEAFARELAALAPLADDGLVEVDGARVTVTDAGAFFVRNVAMVFDAYLHRADAAKRVFSRTV